MQFEKIHNKGQAQLFQNPVLESLTKGHPLVIWGMYIPIMSWLLYHASTAFDFSALKVWGIWAIGIFSWTVFEYIAHRWIFHHVATSTIGKKISYIMHGNHHHYPRDKQRLFMPPVPSIILSSAIFGLQYLLMGNIAFMFFPGFLLGYLMYGSMHYAIHAWNPPFKFMKPLWRNHHLHHYKDEHMGFGVSTTIWDRVFGTMFDLKKEKEDKEKVQELMFGK
ncbi:MAG TPA: sterol desaturase family protein [Phnomibacter sp.]|nr:sterol desaturase family protein [Phnomibacter sp.]